MGALEAAAQGMDTAKDGGIEAQPQALVPSAAHLVVGQQVARAIRVDAAKGLYDCGADGRAAGRLRRADVGDDVRPHHDHPACAHGSRHQ